MDLPIVLVRFNEIALKTRHTRSALRRLLRHNILTALTLNSALFEGIEDTWERLIIHTGESEKVAEVSSKVFGVASTSPAVECVSEIRSFCEIVSDMAKDSLKSGESFAIRVRRVGKHEFTSKEIAVKCGSSVIEALKGRGIEINVDLDSPNHEFFIEVRGDRTFVYNSVTRGVGGLPLGSQGKVVSQLDGYESILATWLMMKRGCKPILVLFDSGKNQENLIGITRSSLLSYAGGNLPIIELPLTDIIGRIETTDPLETCLKYLSMMYIAELQDAEGIVSSERFESPERAQLETIKECTKLDLPVFFPLVGLDDEYAGSLAQRIGGKILAIKIRSKECSRKMLMEDIESTSAFDANSVIEKHREKIREAVTNALTKARI